MSRAIVNRLETYLEPILDDNQFGFRRGRSTQQLIFGLRNIQHAARMTNQEVVVCFIDLRKAFDSVSRDLLWQALEHVGVPPILVSVIREIHEGQKASFVDFPDYIIDIMRGVRQGCVKGPCLFSIFMHCVHKLVKFRKGGIRIQSVDKSDIPTLTTQSESCVLHYSLSSQMMKFSTLTQQRSS